MGESLSSIQEIIYPVYIESSIILVLHSNSHVSNLFPLNTWPVGIPFSYQYTHDIHLI